jgi:hypothetical protein
MTGARAASATSRCHAIEECYEFMLAYAAQGVSGEPGQANVGQLRTLLTRAEEALDGLAEAFREAVAEAGLTPRDTYDAFLAVLDRDARDSLAAIRLVLAQPAISSQTVDNLNASIHLRALLTDIFLFDGILETRAKAGA